MSSCVCGRQRLVVASCSVWVEEVMDCFLLFSTNISSNYTSLIHLSIRPSTNPSIQPFCNSSMYLSIHPPIASFVFHYQHPYKFSRVFSVKEKNVCNFLISFFFCSFFNFCSPIYLFSVCLDSSVPHSSVSL